MSHKEGGQRDPALTPVTALHLNRKLSSGKNERNNRLAEKHNFELPFVSKCAVERRRGLPKELCMSSGNTD